MKLYEQCFIEHIVRLHRRGRKVCNRFYLNEEIYRRCQSHLIDVPFATLTLSDISVNRQSNPSKKSVCSSEDVLYNTIDNNGVNVPKYKESIIVLKIKRLNNDNCFKKVLTNKQDVLVIHLKHDPIPCNYYHTVFELKLNDEIVTFKNYKSSLGHKAYKHLRDDCRLQIAKMIIRREIK